MQIRRKDSNGRVLQTGESERKDGLYQYRYIDSSGKRQAVYAPTLQELRRKEKAIQKQLDEGLNYSAGLITVVELIEKYIELKKGRRYNTQLAYLYVLNLVKKEKFGYSKINNVKVSDAKRFFAKLQRDGRSYNTITNVRGVLKPAFQLACEEDVIPKNPFIFRLADVVVNNSKKRGALTKEQVLAFMTFLKDDKVYSKYYDELVVLIETGMRVSEFCGLTLNDIDFKNRRIQVDHQLIRKRGGRYHVEETKTLSGKRFLPMNDKVWMSLKKLIERHITNKPEIIINGYSGFFILDKNGNPKVAIHIENEMRLAIKKYNKLHPDKPLPNITPHVLRHTFCTNFANAGMNIKSLQYLMGHSDAAVTMNVYSHASYENAAKQMHELEKQKNKTILYEVDNAESEKIS